MAKYKVISEFFYLDQMQKVGSEIEFDGEPGENLEPVDDEAKKRSSDAAARRETKRLALTTPGGQGGMTPEMQDFLAKLADTVKQQGAIIADLQKNGTGAAVDTSNFALKSELATVGQRVDAMAADVSEHDVGLTLINDRLNEVEGVIDSRPASPPPPPPGETNPAEQPAETATSTADTKPPEPPPS